VITAERPNLHVQKSEPTAHLHSNIYNRHQLESGVLNTGASVRMICNAFSNCLNYDHFLKSFVCVLILAWSEQYVYTLAGSISYMKRMDILQCRNNDTLMISNLCNILYLMLLLLLVFQKKWVRFHDECLHLLQAVHNAEIHIVETVEFAPLSVQCYVYTIYTNVCGHPFKVVDSAISATLVADRCIK
jgi:hypothetical protein